MVCGEILSPNIHSREWKLHTYSTFNDCISCESPDFTYGASTFYLQWYKHNNAYGYFRSLRLMCKEIFQAGVLCQEYRLAIKNVRGGYYWTSSYIADEFDRDNYRGTEQDIRVTDLLRYSRGICPGEEPVLCLFFCMGFSPKVDVDYISRTADVGTQTCSDGIDQLAQNFKDLLLNGQKSDVTLKVKGTEFKAHKAILCARSPVFERMFGHDMLEEISGTVDITDCEPEDLRAFLLFLYTGMVHEQPTLEIVDKLYSLADKYNIAGLGPYCVEYLISELSVESFGDILSLASRHCCTEVVSSAETFFVKNMKQVVGTEKWKLFIAEKPAEANDILIKGFSQVSLLPK